MKNRSLLLALVALLVVARGAAVPESAQDVSQAQGEKTGGYENQWHTDVTWRERPAMGAILRCIEVPPVGGDTLFADMAAAYDNLPEAVRLYCNHLQSKGRLHIDVDINGDFGGLKPDFNTAIFRIIQELLQNVVKHAQASHAIVEMERTAEHLSLMVEDNGIGFDAEQQQHGFGLENMKLRVKTLGGSLSVTTQQGAGTAILIRFAGHTNTQHPIVDAKE